MPATRDRIKYVEAGRLGALAVNSDPDKKKAAAAKAVATNLAKNPNHYRDMGRLTGKNKGDKQ
jgi:hypothetical protein